MRSVKLNDDVNAYIFKGRDGAVAAISGLACGTYTVPAKPELKVCDLFGNPSNGNYQGNLLYVSTKLPVDELEQVLTRK